MSPLDKLSIEGFKSIRRLENFELGPVNVLIGANGAGKSNFVEFFQFLRELVEQRLQVHVRKRGGADRFLHLGPAITRQLCARFTFGQNAYEFKLAPTDANEFVFESEQTEYLVHRTTHRLAKGTRESALKDQKDEPGSTATVGPHWYVYDAVSKWMVYHFHDTSETAGVRRHAAVNSNETLARDASNLAAFLYRIREKRHYREIREVVRQAAPFFDDFHLRPDPLLPDQIQLEWRQKDSDYPFRANQLSDGTLRFMCLATALLQPDPPSTMLFDEPELGLHPYALTMLANLIRQVTESPRNRQVIVSTQSVPLLSEFTPEDVVVVERAEGQSTLRRLQSADLSEWLNDYTLGELWLKNVLGGRPSREDVSAPVA